MKILKEFFPLFFWILKSRGSILLYSKDFFPVFKNYGRVVEDNQTSFIFRPNILCKASEEDGLE